MYQSFDFIQLKQCFYWREPVDIHFLKHFPAACLIVSHDRDLLGRCVDEFWLVSAGRVEPYADDLERYSERVRQRVAQPASAAPPNRRERRQAAAANRRQTQQLRNTVKRLERRIESMGGALQALDATLNDPVTYETTPTQQLQALIAQRAALAQELAAAEAEWLEQQQALDAALTGSDAESDEDAARAG